MRRPAFSESRKMGVHSAKLSIWHLIQKEHSDISDFCALKCFYNFEMNSMLEFCISRRLTRNGKYWYGSSKVTWVFAQCVPKK